MLLAVERSISGCKRSPVMMQDDGNQGSLAKRGEFVTTLKDEAIKFRIELSLQVLPP